MTAFGTFVSALLATTRAEISTGCDLKVNHDFSNKQPLVLRRIDEKSQWYEFDNPDKNDSLMFAPGQSVYFACPGSGFRETGNTAVRVKCVAETEFETDIQERPFSDYQCKRLPESKLRRNGLCAENKSAFEVGFEIGKVFIKIMDICFDENTKTSLYVKHEIPPSINGSQKKFKRKRFEEGGLFAGVSADRAYKRSNQVAAFGRALADATATADRYVNDRRFLVRGHLAPRADFVFGAQQAATFYYANAAPQWQSLNSGHWNALETAVRRLAADANAGLTVYTGTHGEYRVPGGHSSPLYLASGPGGRGAVPVPLVFWKVVLDRSRGLAVAFVGVNDPEAAAAPAAVPCRDVCAQLRWLSFKRNAAARNKGLVYCCAVPDFVRTVRTLPPLPRNLTLLTGF